MSKANLIRSSDRHYTYTNYREFEDDVMAADIILNGVYTNYFICSDGRIFTKNLYNKTNTVMDITPKSNYLKRNKSYRRINIYIPNNKYAYGYAHRFVAEAFIPNPDNKPCVNHIDGNKCNNDIHNLEWATFSENNQHAFDTKLHISPKGEDVVWSVLTNKQAHEIGRLLSENELTLGEIAARMGTTYAIVKKIKQGKAWVDAVKPYDVSKHNKTVRRHYTESEIYTICDYLQYTDYSMITISMILGVNYSVVTDLYYKREFKDIVNKYDFSHRMNKYNKYKEKR